MQRPTMEDVAKRAGVSRALVSLVMRDAPNVSDTRRTAVLEAADELGYRLNALASGLASRQTKAIGVILPDLHNLFFAEVVDGLLIAAEETGYRVILNTGHKEAEYESELVNSLLDFQVDGLIMLGPRLASDAIASTARATPTVLVGRDSDTESVDVVVNDDHTGAVLAVRHLAELGHQDIAHIDGGAESAGACARRKGYLDTMTELGLDKHTRVIEGDSTEISGIRAAEKILADSRVPTAIFVYNDIMAAGVLNTLEEAGRDIPGDVSIIGYDNTSLAAMHHLSLSTVHQPRNEMGRLAFETLIDRIENGRTTQRRHVLSPWLVARSTTGSPR